jgi:glutamate synthase domain-containing protein 3
MSKTVDSIANLPAAKRAQGLYDPAFEHDACGAEIIALRKLIETHRKLTHSGLAKKILDDWNQSLGSFYRVSPHTASEIRRSVFAFDKSLQEIRL